MAGANPQAGDHRSGHKWFAAFVGFLRIGATAFGGGSATIVAMRQLALRKGWLTEEEFLETVVLSRVTPGITILAQTILIGRKVDGIRGIVAALIGMLLPSIAITILLARLYVALQDKSWSKHPLEMVAAVAAGFAVALALLLLKDTLAVDRHWRGPVAFVAYVALGAVLRPASRHRLVAHQTRGRRGTAEQLRDGRRRGDVALPGAALVGVIAAILVGIKW